MRSGNRPTRPATGHAQCGASAGFWREIDFPVLGAFDVDESAVDGLASAALADYFITLAPWTWTADDAADVYRRALSLTSRRAS